MVCHDDDGGRRDLRQMMCPPELGSGAEKAVGEEIVNTLGQRIAWVVAPAVVGDQPSPAAARSAVRRNRLFDSVLVKAE